MTRIRMKMKLVDRDVEVVHGIPRWTYLNQPVEEIRAWMWENGLRYVMRRYSNEVRPDAWETYYTIDLPDDAAFEYRIRWS